MTRFKRRVGRWINRGLGAVVLTGCLTISHPEMAVANTSDWTAVAQVRLAAPLPSSFAPNHGGNITSYSTVVHGQSTRSSIADVLHAALATALAAAWLMGGAWVGIRSPRISTPLNQSADRTRNARRIRFK
jgi:hypothetical protein